MIQLLIRNKYFFLTLIIFLISIFLSAYYLQYYYDGHHHGLVLDNAIDIKNGKIPIKDFFTFYAPLSLYINYFILNLFGFSNYTLLLFYSLVYATSLLLFFFLCKKFISDELSFFSTLIIFFLHPVISHPWVNYLVFFFLLISLNLYFSKNKKLFYISAITFFILTTLREGLLFFLIIFYIITLILSVFKRDKEFNDLFKIKKLLFYFLFFLIINLIFYYYLFYINFLNYYVSYLKIPSVFLEARNYDYSYLLVRFIKFFTVDFFKLIFIKNYFVFFSIILILNIFYCILFIKHFLLKKKINSKLFLVSFITLLMFSQGVHEIQVFRYICGASIGLIITFDFVKLDTNKKKIAYLLILFTLSDFNFLNKHYDNNIIFKTHSDKIDTKPVKNKIFTNSYFSKATSDNLDFYENILKNIHQNCDITYFANLQKDIFFKIIASQYFKTQQIFPWYQNNFLEKIFIKHYDPRIFTNIEKNIKKFDIILITDSATLPDLEKILPNLKSNYIKIKLNYSYDHKIKILSYPDKCKL